MSKVDAQRAMREAKYARLRASGPTRREEAAGQGTTAAPTTPEPEAAPKRAPRTPKAAQGDAETTLPIGELCGHKSMNGRECTREAGHSEKSHRYG